VPVRPLSQDWSGAKKPPATQGSYKRYVFLGLEKQGTYQKWGQYDLEIGVENFVKLTINLENTI
jgi:hypothetical protein